MFVFPNDHMNRIKRVLLADHQILLCTYVVEELKDVVARKFPRKSAEIDWFLQSFPFTLIYTPEQFEPDSYPSIRDMADLPILVSAILGDADILVTSDKDFDDIEIEKPEILSPREFLAIYG
jgi:predicted nucleic acid-binding protein